MDTSTPSPVVVGVDLSGSSEEALEWAAAEATRLRRPLHIVHAYPPPTYPSTGAGLLPGGTVVGLGEQLEDAAIEWVTACADRVLAGHPQLEIRTSARCGSAATTLVQASRTAQLVVVGARGRGAVTGMLFGSVSTHLCAHSEAPVVVVQEAPHVSAHARVVVGVDGSDVSQAALGFAVEQASSRGVGLTVLHAWRVEANDGAPNPLGWSEGEAAPREEAVVAEAVAGLGEEYPDVDIRREVVTGNPAHELERVSRYSGLVVVGTRGRGTVSGWLRGSVSQSVLRAARCPVVVVPPLSERDDATGDGRPVANIAPDLPASSLPQPA